MSGPGSDQERSHGSWRELINDAAAGSITLVVGAGLSMQRGVPSWYQLVRWACKEAGVVRNDVPWLVDENAPRPESLMLQIALEEVEHTFRSRHQKEHQKDRNPVAVARRAFADLLSRGLYASLRAASNDSLATVADILRRDQRRSNRRIIRVVTFNADDLLEEEANAGHNPETDPVLWPIARAHHHPRRIGGANGLPPVPVYHVHGYLPRDSRRGAGDSLVFTDAQYWASAANPLSIVNRVVTQALHDSHCVFVGMSMTDLNLNRWLGLHAHEIETTKMSDYAWHENNARGSARSILKSLRRHYWIRQSAAGIGLLEKHLLRRGVVGLPIHNWSEDFRRLMQFAFPE